MLGSPRGRVVGDVVSQSEQDAVTAREYLRIDRGVAPLDADDRFELATGGRYPDDSSPLAKEKAFFRPGEAKGKFGLAELSCDAPCGADGLNLAERTTPAGPERDRSSVGREYRIPDDAMGVFRSGDWLGCRVSKRPNVQALVRHVDEFLPIGRDRGDALDCGRRVVRQRERKPGDRRSNLPRRLQLPCDRTAYERREGDGSDSEHHALWTGVRPDVRGPRSFQRGCQRQRERDRRQVANALV